MPTTISTTILPKRLSRRSVLRGAGICIALPMLDGMMPRSARADTKVEMPKRLAVFSVPFGMVENKFHPTDLGFEYTLSDTLRPLKDLRDKLTVFSNLDHDVRGGHSAAHTFLSGVKVTERARYPEGNITIDQRAAEAVGYNTRFPSLCFWHEGMSFTRTGVRVPALRKPSDAFKLLFVDESQTEKKFSRSSLATSGSILDAVREDAKSFDRTLGKDDRAKLEEYFSSIRDTEKKLQKAASWIDRPKPTVDDPSVKRIKDGGRDDNLGGNLVEVWFDLMFLALQTDSTRVVSAAADNCNWGLEGVKESFHTLSHHGQRPDKLNQLAIVEKHVMSNVGRFVERLTKIKQPDGSTMLDTTQVLFGSGLGSGNRHSNSNLPLILAGGGFKHGQHIDVKNRQPLCNLYLSILQRMGCEIERFNRSNGTLTGLNAAV